jgi:hypothetical protein
MVQAPKNPNYCAIVVALSTFVDLPNCDNVKSAIIYGNSVIVSKDTAPGSLGLFFPVECALDKEFLAFNNLYRKPEFGNADPTKKGFFEEHGRVKAMKFRGHKSEGFWIPMSSLDYIDGCFLCPIGTEFDMMGDHVICSKYVPRRNYSQGGGTPGQPREVRQSRIVEGQFNFHPDTSNLRRNIHRINPTDWISLSDKWHGTSAVFANILVKRKLNWFERILVRFGVSVQDQEYGFTWSSRRVIKGVGIELPNKEHFYKEDIWGVVAKEIKDRVPKGITLYGEIVGYTPGGGPIQGEYTYGCQPGTHRFLVYRVTSTSVDGKIIEFSWQQMKEFCNTSGLEMVKELWFGQAKDRVSSVGGPAWECDLALWQGRFLSVLENLYVNDPMCLHNDNKVPAEGIVVKIDRLRDAEAYKLKNFKFLEWETKQLDQGAVDTETQEDAA